MLVPMEPRFGDTSSIDLVEWFAILRISTHWLVKMVNTCYQNVEKVCMNVSCIPRSVLLYVDTHVHAAEFGIPAELLALTVQLWKAVRS
jgi:hypothetical protein